LYISHFKFHLFNIEMSSTLIKRQKIQICQILLFSSKTSWC